VARGRSTSSNGSEEGHPASLWRPLAGGRVLCDLCAHRCNVLQGKAGVCRVRVNRGGELRTLVFNRLISANLDPIEKKPFFHFQPGSHSLSIATVGCNFRCQFCQNWQISQFVREHGSLPGEWTEPEAVVATALKGGCRSISYTYTEPTIFYETCEAVGLLAREKGLKNNFVTNGYMTPEAARRASSFLDAANVDLKGFDDARYRTVCGATLKGVLEGLGALLENGVWVEVTTLVVPGMNDTDDELRAIARHLRGLSADLPWHISRFHPDYKWTGGKATPLSTLKRAHAIGKEAALRYVYLGNVPGDEAENTYCPNCATMVIGRVGFRLTAMNAKGGKCGKCGAPIAGRFE
jgi:pyruvate formate lyase activating enzyme